MSTALLILALSAAHADEGVWLPEQVPDLAPRLGELGIAVEPDKLARAEGPVLGAVAKLGGCTAAFVSPDGLLLTNAHCVRTGLQFASGGERGDLFERGFSAAGRAAEAWSGPAVRLRVTTRVEDVTARVNKAIRKRMDDAERARAVREAINGIVDACETDDFVQCEVESLYGGLRYRLVAQEEIADVRLAWVPPDAVATYGGDVDNWVWPRHTGDFALVRAYVGRDGRPAPHAEGNVPYHPPAWLPVDFTGAEEGDPVFVAGYPARTERYATAAQVKHAAMVRYPEGVALFDDLLGVLRTLARDDPEAARKLRNLAFSLANQRKYYQGMIDGFARGHVVEHAVKWEAALDGWVQADARRSRRYAEPLAELRSRVSDRLATFERDRLASLMSYLPQLLGAARTAYRFALERERPASERLAGYGPRDRARIASRLEQLDRSLHLPAERGLTRVVLRRCANLPPGRDIPPVSRWIDEAGGVEGALDRLFAHTDLADRDARLALLDRSAAELRASDDPWVQLAVAIEDWKDARRDDEDAWAGAMSRLQPTRFEALMAMRGEPLYPDADGSLRVGFGRVEGYAPAEAIRYAAFTTLAGMAAKAGDPPFALPPALLQRIADAPRSRWATAALHNVPLNFAASLDTTGGSSGSPILDAHGKVVGVAFDRNYEAMAADWAMDPAITRTIATDVRFIAWMMEGDDAGKALLAEMGAFDPR